MLLKPSTSSGKQQDSTPILQVPILPLNCFALLHPASARLICWFGNQNIFPPDRPKTGQRKTFSSFVALPACHQPKMRQDKTIKRHRNQQSRAHRGRPRHVVVADHNGLGCPRGAAGVDERAALTRLLGFDALLDAGVGGLVSELG